MASQSPKRARLTPWYIGAVVILAVVIYVGFQMANGSCGLQPPLMFGVLAVIPIVYLVLMYLTFMSQD